MPKGTNQKFKLYRLAQIMQENTDDSHYMTMPEIMVELKKYGITAERKSPLEQVIPIGGGVNFQPYFFIK